ncbi:MAG: cytochrome c [Phycisphaerales bacterium]|nr:cytochrome c [Phycisphaerales bacterium]MCB9855711.1 cytochrome c [Phycisphaerales bacterium]MCB9862606.1 cytochrome c [Phycisphaerales bacterium]
MMRCTLASIVLAVVAFQVGCDSRPDIEVSRVGETLSDEVLLTQQLKYGKLSYEQLCIGCHGAKGDGNGEAARFLDPKPRNFKFAYFKFSSTRSGELPTDADLKRTIKYGLKGSAMPAFEFLPEPQVEALIAYIKTFSPKWHERGTGSPIPIVDDPYRSLDDKSEAIARGEVIYHGYATCWTCHPAYVDGGKINDYRKQLGFTTYDQFRDGLGESVGKANVEGWMIFPPNFHRDYVRSGADIDSLYRSIAAGITGTAMPTWVDSMNLESDDGSKTMLVQTQDLWALAYYVQSLMRERPTKVKPDQLVVRGDRARTIYINGIPADAAKKQADAAEPAGEEVDVDF